MLAKLRVRLENYDFAQCKYHCISLRRNSAVFS